MHLFLPFYIKMYFFFKPISFIVLCKSFQKISGGYRQYISFYLKNNIFVFFQMSALHTTVLTASIYEKLKTLWSVFMDGVQGQCQERESLFFITQSPGVPSTNSINFSKRKAEMTLILKLPSKTLHKLCIRVAIGSNKVNITRETFLQSFSVVS